VVVTDTESLDRVLGVRAALPALRHVICVDRADADGILDHQRFLTDASDAFSPVVTAADDPALLIYTSGTTGPPKGALHAHRVLLGHLPAIEFYHEYFPRPDDRFWTPADWAWIGGLYDVLFPKLVRELAEYVRTRLSAHAYPRDSECIQELHMTTIGKVRRRDLRELERQRKSGGIV
jgi:acetyl-CoA synthetase